MRTAATVRALGHDCTLQHSAEEGLAWLRQHPKTSAVLLDLVMPEKDGVWFRAQQLADPTLIAIPVVLLVQSGRLARDRHAGAPVLHKPVSLHEMRAVLEQLFSSRTPARWSPQFDLEVDD